jgi:hypothetical protein
LRSLLTSFGNVIWPFDVILAVTTMCRLLTIHESLTYILCLTNDIVKGN